MSKMKLLFTDLDATFLDDNKNVPEANRLAVKEMLEQGHKVIIATGRSLSSALFRQSSWNWTNRAVTASPTMVGRSMNSRPGN